MIRGLTGPQGVPQDPRLERHHAARQATIKDTSLAFIVEVDELTHVTTQVKNRRLAWRKAI